MRFVVAQGELFGGAGRIPRRSRRSTDRAVTELRRLGRLEPVDVGRLAMLRTVADLIDAELSNPDRSGFTMARLITEWRALWGELSGSADSWPDSELAGFFHGEHETPTGPA